MNSEMELASVHNDESRRRPGLRCPTPVSHGELIQLARRVEKTYLARLKMAQRLQNRGAYWNASLIALTISASVASICLLFDRRIYGQHSDVLLVLVAVLTLVASLVVANTNYPAKARHGFETYRSLQRLSVRLSSAAISQPRRTAKREQIYIAFDHEYQAILDESDNHSAADYNHAIKFSTRGEDGNVSGTDSVRFDLVTRSMWLLRVLQILGSGAVTLFPIILTVSAVLFAIPAVLWTLSDFPR